MSKRDSRNPPRRMREALRALTIEPTRVRAEDELSRVADAARWNLGCRVISVERDGQLVGVIPLATLTDQLQLESASGSAMIRISDRAGKYFRQVNAETAGDLMIKPVAVDLDARVEEALTLMQVNALEGLPIWDEGGRVVGYADKLELMSIGRRERHAA